MLLGLASEGTSVHVGLGPRQGPHSCAPESQPAGLCTGCMRFGLITWPVSPGRALGPCPVFTHHLLFPTLPSCATMSSGRTGGGQDLGAGDGRKLPRDPGGQGTQGTAGTTSQESCWWWPLGGGVGPCDGTGVPVPCHPSWGSCVTREGPLPPCLVQCFLQETGDNSECP